MAKFLKLRDQQWTLSDATDVEVLRTQISGAMNDGLATVVEVMVDEKQTADLVLNGKAVEAVLLWEEVPVHKPSFTVID
jgi:hypothetical protein